MFTFMLNVYKSSKFIGVKFVLRITSFRSFYFQVDTKDGVWFGIAEYMANINMDQTR